MITTTPSRSMKTGLGVVNFFSQSQPPLNIYNISKYVFVQKKFSQTEPPPPIQIPGSAPGHSLLKKKSCFHNALIRKDIQNSRLNMEHYFHRFF